MDSIAHGILQARILEWAAFAFSRRSFQPRDQIHVSCLAGGFFTSDICAVLWVVTQLCPVLCDSMDDSPPASSVHQDSPGRSTGVGCRALLQGIFPTQESNWGFLHYRWILYQLSYQGSPKLLCALSLLSCQTLCNPMDSSLPGSSVLGIFQAQVLEWVAISFSQSC